MTLETRLVSCQGKRVRYPTRRNARFELVGEGFLVQENPWVLEFSIETVLDSPDALDGVVHVAVPSQHDHCGVGFPDVQRFACVEVWWDVVLVGDIFVGIGGELAFYVRD